MKTKQVIVIRADLKMRRGKEIAQGSHASLAFLTRQLQSKNWFFRFYEWIFGHRIRLSEVQKFWIDNSYAKVCVRVNSEADLKEIEKKALESGLVCHLITDSGRTEFKGVPTATCLAIGPDRSELIDAVTGHLELY